MRRLAADRLAPECHDRHSRAQVPCDRRSRPGARCSPRVAADRARSIAMDYSVQCALLDRASRMQPAGRRARPARVIALRASGWRARGGSRAQAVAGAVPPGTVWAGRAAASAATRTARTVRAARAARRAAAGWCSRRVAPQP